MDPAVSAKMKGLFAGLTEIIAPAGDEQGGPPVFSWRVCLGQEKSPYFGGEMSAVVDITTKSALPQAGFFAIANL
jgi:hypothetical protein